MASAPKDAAAPAPAAEHAKVEPKKGDYVTDDHILSLTELAAKFSTDVNEENPKKSKGLSNAEAAARLLKYGPNALTPPPIVPQWIKFLIKLSNPLLLMLIGCGALSFITYGLDTSYDINLWLGIILIIVAVGTAFMAWYSVSAPAFPLATHGHDALYSQRTGAALFIIHFYSVISVL